jgi:hypothetical protein
VRVLLLRGQDQETKTENKRGKDKMRGEDNNNRDETGKEKTGASKKE